jgi:peptidoglycan/xylan/chitin deacetylase (PgdA/CDA1 family)
MTAVDVIQHLRALPSHEVSKVRAWLTEHDEESPELLAAIDQGLHSLEQKGARLATREELAGKVRQWAGPSR